MYNVAKKFGYETSENPVDRQLHFSDESCYRRDRVLIQIEEERLMQKAAAHIRPIIQCALLQGLRLQEILTLRISDLDVQFGTITIRPENNKTGKRDTLPIRSEMRSEFKRLITENNGRSPFVFNYENPGTGEYRPITTIRRSFKEACRRAGIEGLQFRDLRRTCATRLHEAGVDPLLVSRLLRHSSMKISSEVYIQSSMKLMKKALAEVDSGPVKTAKCPASQPGSSLPEGAGGNKTGILSTSAVTRGSPRGGRPSQTPQARTTPSIPSSSPSSREWWRIPTGRRPPPPSTSRSTRGFSTPCSLFGPAPRASPP